MSDDSVPKDAMCIDISNLPKRKPTVYLDEQHEQHVAVEYAVIEAAVAHVHEGIADTFRALIQAVEAYEKED